MPFKSETVKTPIFYRTFDIDQRKIDEEKRTVPVAFSSEEPYERYFGIEILSHDQAHVDMSFLSSGNAPLLKDHWRDEQTGIVESAKIDDDRKGRAIVRFSKSQKGQEEFQDVVDGIRKNISVGYQILEKTLIKEEDGLKTYLVTKWKPLEISTVSIPADEKVGIGRGDDKDKEFDTLILTRTTGGQKMPEQATLKPANTPDFDAEAIRKAALDEGRKQAEKEFIERESKKNADVREIVAIGERLQLKEQALAHIREGKSLDEFKNFVMDEMEKRNAQPPQQDAAEIGMSKKDREKYSFIRAIRAVCLGAKDPKFIRDAAFEFDCADAARTVQGKEPGGLIIPHDMLGHRYGSQLLTRTLTAGTATDGAELVADNLLAGSFIDVLRNLTIAMSMGAVTMNGLVGDVLIPRKTSGASGGWISSEGGDASNSEAQFDQVALTPKTAGVYSDLSRQLLMQSTPAAEGLIRDDLAKAMAILIDLAVFYGSGSSGQPTGIANTTGINAPTSFAAAVPTWAEVVAMESAVAVDNALMGTLGYAIEPAMRGSLKTTEKATNTAVFIMGEQGNTLNGYRCAASSQITSGDVFFGNFADAIIGFWGGLDLLVDPYTNSLSGTVRLVAHQSCDVAVRHPVSFAYNNDGV